MRECTSVGRTWRCHVAACGQVIIMATSSHTLLPRLACYSHLRRQRGKNAYIGVLEGAHCGLSSQRTGRVGHTTGNRNIAAALGRARDGGDRNATDGRPFVVRNQIPARIMKPRNRSDRLMALHVVFQDAFGTTG